MKKYFQAPWSLKDIATIVIFITILLIWLILISERFNISDSVSGGESQSLKIALTLFIQWIAMLLPVYLLTKKEKLSFENLGFKKVGWGKTAIMILKAYALYFAISLLIGIVIIFFNVQIPGYQVQKEVVTLFGTNPLDIIIAGILIVAVAPVVEEIIFRGFLLRGLVNNLGLLAGNLVSAALFSAMHFPWQSFIPIFILGLIMNTMVIKSKSIVPSIAFHMCNNFLAFTVQVLIVTKPELFYEALENIEKLV